MFQVFQNWKLCKIMYDYDYGYVYGYMALTVSR